jgi:hypothetical protein
MKRWRASKPAVLAAFTAVLVVPFYVGVVHWNARQFFFYALVASIAMAIGEHLETPPSPGGRRVLFLQGALLWFAAIMIAGGIAYLVAWLF